MLGDRIRMNAITNERVYMRSLALRRSSLALPGCIQDAVSVVKAAGYDLVIIETPGIGQSDTEVVDHSDLSLYVMTPEYGAASQLEKIDMLDFADVIALNKFDKRGAPDALRDIKKQYARNRQLFHTDPEELPVYGTIASQFNDPGVNQLYKAIIDVINKKSSHNFASTMTITDEMSEKLFIIPPNRVRYLSEISDTIRKYNTWTEEQANTAQQWQSLEQSIDFITRDELVEVTPKNIRLRKRVLKETMRLRQRTATTA